MGGWGSSCLGRTRRLWVACGAVVESGLIWRRPLSLRAASGGNHYGRPPQIVQGPFLKNCNVQLKKYNTLVHLTEARNKMFFAEQPYSTSHKTVDPNEMRKFQRLAYKWWDEQGDFAALHSMNDIRVPFIRDTVLNTRNDHQLGNPLFGMKILDVGCGGGLLTEPLGRLGASVTGIDPVEDNVRTAELHKSFDPILAQRIEYKSCTLEDIVEETSETFDIVVASEVVEHVADVEMFIRCCGQVLKPEGFLFITTINKTQLSYIFGIVVAESVLGVVPAGTHDWEKFIAPEELERLLESTSPRWPGTFLAIGAIDMYILLEDEQMLHVEAPYTYCVEFRQKEVLFGALPVVGDCNGFSVKTVKGMLYNPLFRSWNWSRNMSINYALHAVKSSVQKQSDPEGAPLESDKEHLQTEASIRAAG